MTLTLPDTAALGDSGHIADHNLIKTALEYFEAHPSRVAQVVSVTKQDLFTTSSTSYVDVTDLTASITPQATSSKVLVMVSLALWNNTAGYMSRGVILRGSTIIGAGTPASNRPAGSFAVSASGGSAYGISPFAMTHLDSPASASAVVYKVQVAAETGSSATVNRGIAGDTDNVAYPRLASSITLMEVLA